MPLAAGTRIGPYEVRAPIGAGGMGEVYRAHDQKLGRDVAIKVLPEEFARDEERLARFEREARVLASLNHPNIASIHGFEDAGGVKALVLELVEGPTLAERIAKGPIPLEEALGIARQIGDALEAGHESGIVHRDLKPSNVKVREDGTVKVLDYGLAKALQGGAAEGVDLELSKSPTLTRQATQIGVILGTAAYMSPEQAKGKRLDKRTDIWSFGAVLYEMLTGKRAFEGEDVSDTLAYVLTKDPDWSALPSDVPASLRTYLMRCLEKDPKRRVRDVGDLRLAMDGAFDVASETSTPVAVSHGLLPWATAVVASLLTGLGVFGLMRSEPPEVTRFAYELPTGHQLRNTARPVLAVSPDGRRFAYNTGDGVYLRSIDQLDARLLPGTEETLFSLSFSPDGQSIAFHQGPQLKRLAVSGGAAVVVCPASRPLGVHWAPDDTIFFAVPEGILRVPANGGTPEVIVPAAEGEVLDAPQLLPDGDAVLFSVTTAAAGRNWDNGRIVAASLDSGERTVLLEGGSDARYVRSGHLVYALEDGLFAVAFDARSLRVTSGPVSVVEGVERANTAASANYAITEDGTLFFLAVGAASNYRLSWVDRSGRAETIETIPPNEYETPRLSTDGKRVLVVADGDLRIYDLASGRASRLTTDGTTRPYADWAPSGAEVTYTSARGSDGEEVWMQPADGSGVARKLTSLDGRVHFDGWAPDGRTLSAHQHDAASATRQLMVSFDGEKGEAGPWLERELSNISNAVFSPDGRYVALVSEQTGQREIYIHSFPGPGGQTPVSVGGGVEPAWTPTGELFYRRTDDYMMMVVEISTDPVLSVGPPQELFRGRGDPGGSPRARYAVTADGERFLMSADLLASGEAGGGAGRGPKVVIVQNWVEELKERGPVQ